MRKLGLMAGVMVLVATSSAFATEICGNGIDDDGNGLTDEGCYPTMTTGVCESPLSCSSTGMVSWATGSLHYDLAPDIAPAVPYGPGIGFRRFYTSMYSPAGANPTTVNHAPLGPGWQHTYMTWVYPFTDAGLVKRVVVHTSQGRDVYYTFSTSDATYDYYTPQAGDHVMSLKLNRSSSEVYLQLLTGETLRYNQYGQISEIWDTYYPTPNKVTITWTGTSNANVQSVIDADGNRKLVFAYTNNLLTSIQFQVQTATLTWTTQHTTTYDYSNYVTRDATSGWFIPSTATEWTNLLSGTGLPNPGHAWQMQETSGNLADSLGSTSLTASGTGVTYNSTQSGWTRKGVSFSDGATGTFTSASSLCNPASTSCTVLALVAGVSAPASERQLMMMGDTNGNYVSLNPFAGNWYMRDKWNGTTAQAAHSLSTSVASLVITSTPGSSSSFGRFGIDTVSPTWSTGTSASGNFKFGGGAPVKFLYAAEWVGTGLTPAQAILLNNKVQNGPGILTTVTIGGQVAQQNHYVAGYLSQITDAAGLPVSAFAYSSSVPGQVASITTPHGVVGFEYGSTRTSCTGKTMLYFNLGNTTSCSVDSDCGTGLMCGGKTGSGATGQCFLAGRCLTTSTVNGESVVTTVAPIAPGGGTCDGACTDVSAYTWAATSGLVSPIAKMDALSNYTSITYNSDGLPTQVGYGDTDTDPTNGGTNRTVYYYYDTTYRGRLAEVRRPSDLSTGCTGSSATGCKRTLYTYGTDQQLATVEEDGYTLNSSGTTVSYANTITYHYDSVGRINEIDGAVSGIKTTFDFTAASFTTPLASSFLSASHVYTDATNHLDTSLTTYDFWGHPTTMVDPNGHYTCDTYDGARGTQTERRRAMTHNNCTVTAGDLVTTWYRDSALRLVAYQESGKPMNVYRYNMLGQLDRSQRCDNGSGHACGSTGDYQLFTYTTDGQLKTVESHDEKGALTARSDYAYYPSRRLQKEIDPTGPGTYYTGYTYDDAGRVTRIDGQNSLSRTDNTFAGAPGRDGRVTSVDEYKTASTSDSWSLLYAWQGQQNQLTDGDSKVTASLHDDLGRMVKQSNPDYTGNTYRVFDAASRMTTIIEDQGGAGQQTHTFTYDAMNRRLNDDYADLCTVSGGGVTHPEIQRSYDVLPSGVTCPLAGGCTNLKGHLAYVVTTLMCSSTYASTDGALDQQTYYAYDADGKVVEEYITDDSGRSRDTQYGYTNGLLTSMTTPYSVPISWTYGSGATNSDADRITSISYYGSAIIDGALWSPFGPWTRYNWEATIGGVQLRSRVDRDLAYRIGHVYEAETTSGTENDQVTVSRDAMGRVTSRVYAPHNPTLPGLYDSYYLYDEQSRVLCETTDLQTTCPTTGSNIKNGMSLSPPFTNAGDWKRVLRPMPGTTGLTNDINSSGTTYGTSHQITDVNQSDGTPILGHTSMAYDARGNRSYDDNTTTLTHDRRDYTYDGRRNVINVRGEYYTGSVWHYYDVASAYDQKNRRVFKSYLDETTGKTAQWFFYYDVMDRLTEVRYTPDTSAPGTSTNFNLVWLEDRLVAYGQIDTATGAVSKRYVASDETNRPIKMWSWPASGNSTLVWAINESTWGNDITLPYVTGIYQPVLFAGQYRDSETTSYQDDGTTQARIALALNGFRTYDSFTGSYLQVDPLTDQSWSSYGYAAGNPVENRDILGLEPCGPVGGCNGGPIDGPGSGYIVDPGYCGPVCQTLCFCGVGFLDGCNCDACSQNVVGPNGTCPTGTHPLNPSGDGSCYWQNGCSCESNTAIPVPSPPTNGSVACLSCMESCVADLTTSVPVCKWKNEGGHLTKICTETGFDKPDAKWICATTKPGTEIGPYGCLSLCQ